MVGLRFQKRKGVKQGYLEKKYVDPQRKKLNRLQIAYSRLLFKGG